MEQELSRVRRLRDSCRNEESLRIVTTETVETLWSHVINAKKGDEYAKKLAGASSQCAANLAAAGLRDTVWVVLMREVNGQSLLEVALEETSSEKTRAAIIATAHNCICLQQRRAMELARAARSLELVFCHEGDASHEWSYLLACALFRQGAARAAFAVIAARKPLLEFALSAVNSEADSVYCEDNDVALAALEIAITGPHDLRALALEICADATAFGPASRAPALRKAGAIECASRAIEELPVLALKVIANVCHLDACARDEARPAIPDILSKCKVDTAVPLQREWAVFAIRNICHENEANRRYIAALEPQAVATSRDELEALGVEAAELITDPLTGRKQLQVTRRRPSPG